MQMSLWIDWQGFPLNSKPCLCKPETPEDTLVPLSNKFCHCTSDSDSLRVTKLLKVNLQYSEAPQRKHLISAAMCLRSQMAAPLYCAHKGTEPRHITSDEGVYFQFD